MPYIVFSGSCLAFPASILHKSTAGRSRPVSYPDGPLTARYRFMGIVSSFSKCMDCLGRGSWLLCFTLVCGLCIGLFALPLCVIGRLKSVNVDIPGYVYTI